MGGLTDEIGPDDRYRVAMAESLGDRLRRIVLGRPATAPRRATTADGRSPRPGAGVPPPSAMRAYPGDYTGVPAMAYAPQPNGHPDPGEVVWTWVPFEEDAAVGKDRPVLLVGHDGDWLLGVMLTSKDHDRDTARERAEGREWIDVGAGAWDRQGRPSEARTDRVIRIDPQTVRREGAVLDAPVFETVTQAIRRSHDRGLL